MPRVPLGTYWKVEARIDCWQSQSEKQMEREQAASARRAQRFYLTLPSVALLKSNAFRSTQPLLGHGHPPV